MEIWSTDIGNKYLEPKTLKKIFIISGNEFGDRGGHIIIVHNVVYGIIYSGFLCHESFSDRLRDMLLIMCL